MDTLDIFSNLENQSLDSFDLAIKEEKEGEISCPKKPSPIYFEGSLDSLTKEEENEAPYPEQSSPVYFEGSLDSFNFPITEEKVKETSCSKQPNSVYFGKSFEYAGRWTPGQSYYNDNYRVTFVVYKNYLLACNLTHTSSEETEPVILYEDGNAVGVENMYWQLVLSGDSGKDLINVQAYIAELQEKVNKNSTDIETNNAAVEIVSKQYNLISQHLDNTDNRHKEIEEAFSKQTPWIGSKEEYESLEDKDPDKFYFIYEE